MGELLHPSDQRRHHRAHRPRHPLANRLRAARSGPVRRPRGGDPVRARPRADLAAAAVAVVVAAAFWVQRDYREPLSGVFPNLVLVGLVVLAVLLVARTFLLRRRAAGGAVDGTPDEAADETVDETVDEPSGGAGVPIAMVFASMAFLAAWVALLTPLGFTLAGILAFLAITVFVRRGSFRPKHLLIDVPVAIVVVWLCFIVFTRVLLVPLPVPPFIYG
ncbi:MAG: hypothetical protein GEV03_06890 [Streptosporangiales bacterium]|nr:hypothetical protein [Streptosporangiales bacterium]